MNRWIFRPAVVPILLAGLLYAGVTESAAQVRNPGGSSRSYPEITINGRVQMQVNTSSADDVPPTDMIVRRARFGVDVAVNDYIRGRVQPDFAGGSLSLGDAYILFDLDDAFQLLAGRAYRLFSLLEQTGSLRMLPIERGLRIRGVDDVDLSALLTNLAYSDREVGVQLRGAPDDAPLGFAYSIGIFRSPVQNLVDDFTHQYVARVSVSPLERTRIGAGWSRRDFYDVFADDLEPGNAFTVDLEYGGPTPTPGFHFLGEVATGVVDPFNDRDFTGAQAWLGYRFETGRRVQIIEPLIRVSHVDVDTLPGAAELGGALITPGLNLYLGGLNRIMLNFDLWDGARGQTENSFKLQVQMAF